MSEDVVKTKKATIRLRSDGILEVDINPGADYTLEDAKDSTRAQELLGNGKRRPLLVKLGTVKSIEREARAWLTDEKHTSKCLTAAAVIVASPIGKIIGNVMMGFHKNKTPTRLFSSEGEAVEWLKGHLL